MAIRKDSLLDRLRQSFRQERSLPPPSTPLASGYGVPHVYRPEAPMDAYGDNVWLYSSVTKIVSEIARTKFKLRTREAEPKEVTEHQALETLQTPQPIHGGKSMLTSFDLKYVTGLHLVLPGEAFWVLQDRLPKGLGGGPGRIDVALPHLMYPKLTEQGDLKEYRYQLPQGEITLPPEDVVHFKLPDPKNLYRGHSPAQAVRMAVDSHFEADVLNLKTLANGGLPQGILNPEANLNREQAAMLRDQWSQMYGGSRNGGKVAVMPGKMTFQELSRTPQEMQYAEGKKTNRDEILAAYGVGLEILGRTESQTRANAEAAIFVFMKFGVTPFLDKFVDTLNNDYLVAFPGTENLEFYYDDPVPENLEEKRATGTALFNAGALTPDEFRKMFGLDPLEIKGVTDTPYVPFAAVPAGTEKEEPPAPAFEEDDSADE